MVLEAKPVHVEEALLRRAGGASLEQAAGLHPGSAEVEHLVTVAEAISALPSLAVDADSRRRLKKDFLGQAESLRTAWVHNHSVAHKRSRHPVRRHPLRWFLVVGLAVFLAVMTGIGVALAAQISEPDSRLYPTRILSEKALLAVTRDPVGKAGVHIDFSNQRFRDAESMAARGKSQLALDALTGYFDELRTASQMLAAVKVRDKRWIDMRKQLQAAEVKRFDIVQLELTNTGHRQAAATALAMIKSFETERQTLDKALVVQPATPAPTATPPPSG